MQRRILVLAMVIILVLAGFSACGNTNTTGTPTAKAQEDAGAAQSTDEPEAPEQSVEASEQSVEASAETQVPGADAEAEEGQDASEAKDPAGAQETAQNEDGTLDADEPESDAAASGDSNSGLLQCGEVFTYGDLQYHVLRVKDETTGDGERFLLVKMEVFNNGSNDVNFSSLLSFELTDKSGRVTYAPSPFARTEGNLDGTLLGNGRLVGEVAIELGDSTDQEFVMNIAQNFEYKPAWQITENDIGMTFAEVFESVAPKSEYTVGIPLETENLTVLLKSVSWEESDKEGLSVLLCEMELRNNSSNWLEFMLGMDYDVYSVNGSNLKVAAGRFDFPSEVEAEQTVSGIASFYFETGTTDFYMTVSSTAGGQQLVGDMMQNEIITFSLGSDTAAANAVDADAPGSDIAQTDADETDQDAVADGGEPASGLPDLYYLVPAFPTELLPIYPEATVVDSMYDYRGGTGQVSKYEVTAELSMPATSYEDAVAFYSGYGFKKETLTTNEGQTEETHFTGSLDKYTVKIQLLKFLHEERDTLGSIVLNY